MSGNETLEALIKRAKLAAEEFEESCDCLFYDLGPVLRKCGRDGATCDICERKRPTAYLLRDLLAALPSVRPGERRPLPDHDNHHNALLCPYCNQNGALVDRSEQADWEKLLPDIQRWLSVQNLKATPSWWLRLQGCTAAARAAIRRGPTAPSRPLDDGVVEDLPPMPAAQHTDATGACHASAIGVPGYCGLPKRHTGPLSWERR